MPSLDVTEVLCDPDLADSFDVRRAASTVGDDGRGSTTPALFPGQTGVVTWDTGDAQRGPDGQIAPETIEVVTPFSLRGVGFGFQPDVVVWRGAEYKVIEAKPFQHFGRGFTSARCVSTRALDRPPPE